ncbi:Beta-mannosidase B [Escovopsis weberi]|uniref:Beta-mannosidase B n=1 Tax=Escovopsis weberi TaxID=150374 RepID=A0A0M9VSS0_ESCWE|nr:Beta-mannosidase B [Escovopsis weberi]
MALRQVIPIDKDWHFRQADKDKETSFLPVSQFPTNVHLDLLHHNLIPDPFVGKNEDSVQWVAESRWQYRTRFASPRRGAGDKAVLVFHGLDTFATVALNGETILETDNMFISERLDVSGRLAHGENELVITFESAYLKGWERVDKTPNFKWGEWNGDHSRLAVRKAQYHWGWDWGPALNTCGPWRPIELEVYSSRIADLHAAISLDDLLERAEVAVHVAVEGHASRIRLDISLDGARVASETADAKHGAETTVVTFHIKNPKLWYPRAYGKQPLYTIAATLLDAHGKEADSAAKRIGIRKAELVQEPLEGQPGLSFFFRVNNVPVFCGGSNWIPADSFVPRISKQRYRDWIELLAEGNQAMIRVWGGGIYEEQEFFDACDELGILVQQDFLFGCGNYPTWPEMLESIRREAEANVRLLRHHPSIVIWAGNNEDYQYQESEGLTYDFEDKKPENWLKTDFPARYIYEKLLADVCRELIPDTYYHYGSPWGGKDTRDPTVGDIHQWNIWHGDQDKYQDADKLVGRFVSEFGMEAFPCARTIEAFLPGGKADPERYSSSSTVDFHNKATGFERRIALYLAENIRFTADPLEHFIYATQLMQAECLSFAFRLWKRQWQGPRREYCSGALVWQLNDCWPVTSWAICDYYLRPKAAYWAVKREMAPTTVSIRRVAERRPRAEPRHSRVAAEDVSLEIWATNLALEPATVDVVVRAWDVVSGRETHSSTVAAGLTLQGNRSTEVAAIKVPVETPGAGLEGRTIVAAYLVEAGGHGRPGRQIARFVDWPQPLKHVLVQDPKRLGVTVAEGGKAIVLEADVPVKGVFVECEDDDVKLADNMVDLVPGEAVRIDLLRGHLKDRSALKTMYYGMPAH